MVSAELGRLQERERQLEAQLREAESAAAAEVLDSRRIRFETNRPLQPNEAMTVADCWPLLAKVELVVSTVLRLQRRQLPRSRQPRQRVTQAAQLLGCQFSSLAGSAHRHRKPAALQPGI